MRSLKGAMNMDRFARLSSCRTGGLSGFARDESGATAIEYAMIAAGLSVAIITAVNTLGDTTKGMYEDIATKLNAP
jgi:pilus assembly protein Flp/PilA